MDGKQGLYIIEVAVSFEGEGGHKSQYLGTRKGTVITEYSFYNEIFFKVLKQCFQWPEDTDVELGI